MTRLIDVRIVITSQHYLQYYLDLPIYFPFTKLVIHILWILKFSKSN